MKTTLKTAKFTFKTAFARCVAANAVVVSCISVAKVAKWWCDCGMFCRGCGGFNVFFRRLQDLFTVKMRCGNGKNMVRKWQKCGAEMAVGGVVAAKLRCIFGVYMLDFLHFGCQGGEIVVRLRRLVVWLRGFRVWFLYDLVADAAFGNL